MVMRVKGLSIDMYIEQTIGIHDIIGKHDVRKSSILKKWNRNRRSNKYANK